MNPLLAKVKLPGRVFQLPSKGVFYRPGVLSDTVKDGEVQVRPMSALAEMKLRSADLLMSGKILKELCDECVPEIRQPDELVSQDVDALFAFLRIVTYGSMHRVTSAHTCEKAKAHQHDVDIEAIVGKPNNKLIDHFDSIYRVPLTNGQIVLTRPNTYAEAMRVMYMRNETLRKESAGEKVDERIYEKIALSDLLSVIRGVEDDGELIDDPEMIEEWLRIITKPVLNEILESLKKVSNWGFDFSTQLKCPDCGEMYVYELDLDPISFFLG